MAGFITYNPFDPFDGPKASDPPPPAYSENGVEISHVTIEDPSFPGSAVQYRTSVEESAQSLEESLVVKGQGVVSVRAQPKDLLAVTVDVSSTQSSDEGVVRPQGVVLLVARNICRISWIDEKGAFHPFESKVDPNYEERCYLKNYEANYWLSFDLAHGRILYGIGLQTVKCVLVEINLKTFDKSAGIWEWNPGWAWLEKLQTVKVNLGKDDTSKTRLAITPLPIVTDLPPLIRSGDKVSLSDLEGGQFTVPENLPVECQKLYYNVAGIDVTLDTPDFPDFSSAIEYSVNTPGAYGYKLLQHKQGELGKDIRGTYLRITIGTDLGNSPGVPYVLEIWPAGHFSPIHDHGDAYAVIKVLHGSIECTYYDSLQESPLPNPLYPNPFVLQKGDVTWLGQDIYQIHRLRNLSTEGKVCCTVQCYQYGEKDRRHYEAFRWFKEKEGDEKEEVKDFKPNSDADLATFKNAIREEWKSVVSGKPPRSIIEAAGVLSNTVTRPGDIVPMAVATFQSESQRASAQAENQKSVSEKVKEASTMDELSALFAKGKVNSASM